MHAPINVRQSLARMDGDRKTFDGLASMFIDRSVQMIERIRHTVAQRDGDAVYQATHSLLGSLATFYAAPVIATAEALQGDAKSSQWSQADRRLVQLESEMAQVVESLRHEV